MQRINSLKEITAAWLINKSGMLRHDNIDLYVTNYYKARPLPVTKSAIDQHAIELARQFCIDKKTTPLGGKYNGFFSHDETLSIEIYEILFTEILTRNLTKGFAHKAVAAISTLSIFKLNHPHIRASSLRTDNNYQISAYKSTLAELTELYLMTAAPNPEQALRVATNINSLEFCQNLLIKYAHEKTNILKSNDYQSAFLTAAKHNYFALLLWLWEQADATLQKTLLEKYSYACFWGAAEAHVTVLEWLWSKATPEQQDQMLRVLSYIPLRTAAASCHIEGMKWVWSKLTTVQRVLAISYNIPMINNAVEAKHFPVLIWLWNNTETIMRQLDYPIFNAAVRLQNLSVLEWQWKVATSEQQQLMLQPRILFVQAVKKQHLQVIDFLWDKYTLKQQCEVAQLCDISALNLSFKPEVTTPSYCKLLGKV